MQFYCLSIRQSISFTLDIIKSYYTFIDNGDKDKIVTIVSQYGDEIGDNTGMNQTTFDNVIMMIW